MKIAILGATGKFGTLLTENLFEKTNHELTLISKSAEDVFENNERINALNIDATNFEKLKMALEKQDLVYSAISGGDLPVISENLVEIKPKRLIFMAAVGIYNELPQDNGAEYNVDNEPSQIPNRKAADIIESSNMDYTILRPGFLRSGEEDNYVIAIKGETPSGYITSIDSVVNIALEIIENQNLYLNESISITRN